jgi:hypothetical protein
MTQVQTLGQPLHALVLEAARRSSIAVDETHYAVAFTQEASIGVAPLSLSADELSDLRAGRNVMFITLSLPAGVDKTTDGMPIADGAYLLNVSINEGDKVAARLMTTAGREIGALPVDVTPTHPHPDRFAVSSHITQCSATADMAFTVFGHTIAAAVTVTWC